jgi:hypothetical protein
MGANEMCTELIIVGSRDFAGLNFFDSFPQVLSELPGNVSGPASRLLAWWEIQSDCISHQAHRSLIPRMGAK